MNEPPGTQPQAHSLIFKYPSGFRRRRGRNWFFLGLTYASYYLCRYNLAIVAPELKETLGFSNAQYGAIQSARDLAYAIGQFVNGLFTDRLGGKQAMTLGAIGTILLNLLFGITCWSNIAWLFFALMVVRLVDGYIQAFGAPGMVKINTAWFRRQERGGFAGIFGGMIQLGAIGVGQLGRALATGLSVPIIFFGTVTIVPKLDWRFMFIIPPVIVLVIITLMNLAVKNHPEEAGYRVVHDDETHDEDPHQRLELADVLGKITRNKIVWIVAGAYFCTGFVRQAINSWWVIYMKDVWTVDKAHPLFVLLVWAIPFTAFLGSLGSGLISDKLVGGRRAPVAAILYFSQAVFIAMALLTTQGGSLAQVGVAIILLIGINTACNATHSILGTAAAMDLGGRKMAGFASGVIDSFQYYGSFLAGLGLGSLLDYFAQADAATANARLAAATAPATQAAAPFHAAAWFTSMLPFAILGTVLMTYLWFRHRGTDVRGT